MRLSNKCLTQWFCPFKLWGVDELHGNKVYNYLDTYFCYDEFGHSLSPDGIRVGDVYRSNRYGHDVEITSIEHYHGAYNQNVVNLRSVKFDDITYQLSVNYFLHNLTLHKRYDSTLLSQYTNIKKHKFV